MMSVEFLYTEKLKLKHSIKGDIHPLSCIFLDVSLKTFIQADFLDVDFPYSHHLTVGQASYKVRRYQTLIITRSVRMGW